MTQIVCHTGRTATHLCILERDQQAVELVLERMYCPDSLEPCDGPVKSMFTNKVEASNCRWMDYTILTRRLRTANTNTGQQYALVALCTQLGSWVTRK